MAQLNSLNNYRSSLPFLNMFPPHLVLCFLLVRGRPFSESARLGNGGKEPLRHVRPGSCDVCLHDPHPVQVLLQTKVKVGLNLKVWLRKA